MGMYVIYCLTKFFSNIVPRSVCLAVGRRIADFCFVVDRSARRAVIDNISHVRSYSGCDISSREERRGIRRLARETFHNFAVHIADFMRIGRLEDDIRRGIISFQNFEAFEEAFARGKGAVLVTSHLGNWELGGAIIASRGYPVNVAVMRLGNAHLNKFFSRLREEGGMRPLPLGRAARGSFQALKRKETVALLADRVIDGHGSRVRFLGEECMLPRGPAEIAARSGAPVVMGYNLQEESGRFTFVIDRIIEFDNVSDRKERALRIQEAIVEGLERYISRYPSQWFAFYKVWNI